MVFKKELTEEQVELLISMNAIYTESANCVLDYLGLN
jgi:hypothetical protein